MTIQSEFSQQRNSHDIYPLAGYCRESYSAYKRQVEVIVNSAAGYECVEMVDFPIKATGPEGEPLSIYAVKRQYGNPTHVVIRFSGSHGIEGYIGAAGQLYGIESTFHIPHNTLIIEVFAYNVWGFCNLRRSSSRNYDYNFTHFSKSSPDLNELYQQASVVKTKKRSFSFPLIKRKKSKPKIEKADYKELLEKGQSKTQKGLFYNGGESLDDGTEALFTWLENEVKTAKRVVCIDIHSEPGVWLRNSLRVFDYNSLWSQGQLVNSFGDRIEYLSGEEIVNGDVLSKVHELVQRVNEAAEVIGIRQTIETYSLKDVIPILFDENIAYMELAACGKSLPSNHLYKKKLLEAFYPSNREWRHMAVSRMKDLFEDSISFSQFTTMPVCSTPSRRNTMVGRFSKS